jgi:hypothetical protein
MLSLLVSGSVPAQALLQPEIATGFTPKKVSVEISNTERSRTFESDTLSNLSFTESEVTRAQIEDDIDPSLSKSRAGTIRDPRVLADLTSDCNTIDRKYEVTNGSIFPTDRHRGSRPLRPRLKPTGLIVHSVTGEVLLSYEALNFAVRDDRGYVVHRSRNRKG